MSLEDTKETIVQRTGQSFDLTTGDGRNRFLTSLRTDVASIVNQLNNVYMPLIDSLVSTDSVEPLDIGLAGTTLYTDPDAVTGAAEVYFDSTLQRPRSIRESFDKVITDIANLSTSVTAVTTADWEDTAADLLSANGLNSLNLQQLADDTVGANYTLNGDGLQTVDFPLAQHIDAIGSLLDGFPGTGLTYSATYPTIALTVPLSDVVIDTTIPESTITNLVTHLDSIRDFVGMDTAGPELPTYSDWASLTFIEDDQPLEQAIAILDEQVAAAQTTATTLSATYAGAGTQLSTDGLTATSSNVPRIGQHTAFYVVAEWIALASNGVTSAAKSGTVHGLVRRLTGAALIDDYASSELTAPSGTGRVILPSSTTPVASFVAVGGSGGFTIEFASLGFAIQTQMLANVRFIAVRNDGT